MDLKYTRVVMELIENERRHRDLQRYRMTMADIDFNEGDLVIAEGSPAHVARISYADEPDICVFPENWRKPRNQFGPLSYTKDSPLLFVPPKP